MKAANVFALVWLCAIVSALVVVVGGAYLFALGVIFGALWDYSPLAVFGILSGLGITGWACWEVYPR